MATSQKVTVERSYFEALLRRADFHTSSTEIDPSISISRVEYDGLLQCSREYHALKEALFQGGITEDTLNLLISTSDNPRKDSGVDTGTNEFGFPQYDYPRASNAIPPSSRGQSWRTGAPTYNSAPGSGPFSNTMFRAPQNHSRQPATSQRYVSYDMPSMGDDHCFEDDDMESQLMNTDVGASHSPERRTLYFTGLSDRTTFRDLLSVIKGGKLVSVRMGERTATVSFVEGAAEFLAWAKRNDIYLQTKRIEVKWADRQFHLKPFTSDKVFNGATRNIVVRNARSKHFTEAQIRDDMDHIHNLIIVSVEFRGADAYISTNSIHNALFARTCMMSRTTYKGCKVEFYPDECDVPLPAKMMRKYVMPEPVVEKKKTGMANRFGLLSLQGCGSSDQENRTPSPDDEESEGSESGEGAGVSLDFLD